MFGGIGPVGEVAALTDDEDGGGSCLHERHGSTG